MVLGFNHNVRYKDEVFHIQTEDSGVKNPHIITLLYRGGVIISSQKTNYADRLGEENLPRVVEGLMKEQHKEMLRRLKSGEFDSRAFSVATTAGAAAAVPAPPAAPEPAPEPPPTAEPVLPFPEPPTAPEAAPDLFVPFGEALKPANKPARSLDDVILDFFTVDDKKDS